MKKFLVLPLIIASLFRAEVAYTGEPSWTLWGNPKNITYDASHHLWVNDNPKTEMWRWADRTSSGWHKLVEPEHVPEKKTTVIVFRMDTAKKQEFWYAQAFAVAAVQQQKRRFVLINVEQTVLDNTKESDKQYRVWPHLGLLYVGTAAHNEGWDVVLYDELVQGQVDLARLVEPGDVVGLSLVVTGIERGVELARQAKTLGAIYVIAGNDSAIFRANQVLALPGKPIDAVFTSNSLTPVRQFFRNFGKSIRIPDVQVEPGGVTQSNEREHLVLELKTRKELERQDRFDTEDVFTIPKLDLFSQSYWDEVWGNYRTVFGHKHPNRDTVKNGIALFASGCTRTGGTDVCLYCTIKGVGDIRVPSEEYLARTLDAYERFGIRMIFNTTDSAYEMEPLVKRLQNVGASLDALSIYGRAQGLASNPKLLDEWLRIVRHRLLVNVGMDSGDTKTLEKGIMKSSRHKGQMVDENYEAVRRIRESGAHLHYSLIFGSPGETVESCNRSIEFLEWSIATLGSQLDIVESDLFWLNFGSPAGKIFHDYDYAQTLAALVDKSISRADWYENFAKHSEELIVPWSTEQAWYHYFTDIDIDVAQEYNKRVGEIMARHEGSISGRAYKPSKEDA